MASFFRDVMEEDSKRARRGHELLARLPRGPTRPVSVRPDRRALAGAGLLAGAVVGVAWLSRVGADRYRGLVLDEQIGLWAEDVAARAVEPSSRPRS